METNLLKPLSDYRLWVVAGVALAIMSLLTFFIPMQGSQTTSVTGWLSNTERASSSEKMTEVGDALWAPLTYFGGVTMGTRESGFGLRSHNALSLRSNPLIGALILLLAFLWACAWTRRSATGWFMVMPTWAMLILSFAVLLSKMSGSSTKLAWFGLLFWILVIPLLVAFVANRVALALSNRGTIFFDMIDADDDDIRPYFCTSCGNSHLTRHAGVYTCKRCHTEVDYLNVQRKVLCPTRIGGCGREISATGQFCPWCGFYVKKDFQPATGITEGRVGI